ncbi:heparinase II/III domain-containing protein [Paenibacillus lignilyticus]|uniref:Heparinase II/III family protein n=1 Tax=Paenibacillus lignilyticus TaxID=1172615 RepID=A0ABS5C9X1_9BACL|nr:heparinase II/III family protein [Paenibacillus lignilyticus]MBP3962792.1 heparinase II/III family protein [Paenibacillus lignilyticus]
MLAQKYGTPKLGEMLLPRENFRPYPTIEDRPEWDGLPLHLRTYWMNKGIAKLNHAWNPLPATAYMDYSRTGNRERYDKASWERRRTLASLVIAECMENEGRFLDDIVNGIWCICEETFWGIPGHGYMMKRQDSLPDMEDPVIELFSAETAALLAWTHYLMKSKLDSVSKMVCERIRQEVKRRILDPYLTRFDLWWMGFNQERMLNNWNPWCNSNCLAAFLLLEDDPERREAAAMKAMRSLDHYLERLRSDGGCEEGPKYWLYAGGMLFDGLELLYSVSARQIHVYDEPLIQQIGRYIYRAFIDDAYYVNFADSTAKVQIPAELAYRYGRRIGDDKLAGLGAMVLRKKREETTDLEFPAMSRLLPALFHYSEAERYVGETPYVRDAWLDGIQVMVARERQGTSKGLFVAAKGGHNDESHNHNDIGHFIVYCNGSPMIIDPGMLTYTSQSFFEERYSIWAMQSAYHNVPIVNGIQQRNGSSYRAADVDCKFDDRSAALSLDIGGAYPDLAEIRSWLRTISLIRGSSPCIEIKDEFLLQHRTDEITLHLLSPHLPRSEGDGSFVVEDECRNRISIQFNSAMFAGSVETIPLEDAIMQEVWGERLYRIHLKIRTPLDRGECMIRISEV